MGHATTGTGSTSLDVARTVTDPALWIAATALNAIAHGVLWLMAIKPGWIHSIVVVVVLGAIGGVVGSTLAFQDLQPIAWRHSQVLQMLSGIQQVQLPQGGLLCVMESLRRVSLSAPD